MILTQYFSDFFFIKGYVVGTHLDCLNSFYKEDT